jgi:hypothetical protein
METVFFVLWLLYLPGQSYTPQNTYKTLDSCQEARNVLGKDIAEQAKKGDLRRMLVCLPSTINPLVGNNHGTVANPSYRGRESDNRLGGIR